MKENIVKKESQLLEYLYETFNNRPKKDVKRMLSNKMIYVNNEMQTQFNYPLNAGDVISVGERKVKTAFDLIYEDKEFIVINKPSGLLSMATDKEKNKTAYHLVREYLKEKKRNEKVFIVHRLDQFTSGVLMFAKNESIKNKLQDSWNDIVTKRGYIAIVEGEVREDKKTIKSYLKESKTQVVYSTNDKSGKLAITNYKVLQKNKHNSLLEVYLDTGRKNQIRVHMQEMHHSIVGDTKYGAKTNPIKRLALHSHELEFKHPINNQVYNFKAQTPLEFKKIFKGNY